MTKSTSGSLMSKLTQRLRSLTDRQMIYILIGLGAAVVVLVGVFILIYVRDRYAAPAPNLGTAEQRLSHMEELVRQDPNNLELRLSIAQGYYSMRRYPDVLAQANEVLKIEADNQTALTLRGLAAVQLNENDAALADFQRVIELNKDNSMAKADERLELAYYYAGLLYNRAQRYGEAEGVLKSALEINLGDADAWLQLGEAYAGLGRPQEALDAYEQVVRFVPDYVEAYQGMERSYRASHQTGLADYARAMGTFSAGNAQQAAVLLEELIERQPDVLEAYLGLGLAYERLGERDKAIKALEHYVAERPGDVAAEQALARIRRSGQ